MTPRTRREVLKAILVAALASLILSGCVKARVEVEVARDGSGTMSIALGMTQEALSLAGEDGQGLMETLSQEVSREDNGEEVTVRRWTEGNYEWVGTTTSFDDLEELNSRLAEVEGFERLSVTRQRGVVRDLYVLDGEIDPLMAGEEAPEDLFLDPSGMFELQMAVSLPGDVLETNGAFLNESDKMVWTLGTYEPITIRAVSRAWNWTRVGLLAGAAGLSACGAVVVVVGAMVLWRRTLATEVGNKLKGGDARVKEDRREETVQTGEREPERRKLSDLQLLLLGFGAGAVVLACIGVGGLWWIGGRDGRGLGAITSRSTRTATVTPGPTDTHTPAHTPTGTSAPSETPMPTETLTGMPAGTDTSAPTKTPTARAATQTPVATETPQPTNTQLAASTSTTGIGRVRVDHWVFEVEEVKSDRGTDSSRQNLVLLGQLTNEGRHTDTFVALYTLVLRDSQGRTYQEDPGGLVAAMDKYGAEIPASISPEATVYTAITFDVPASEKTFSLVPGSLAASWSGEVTFSVP